MASKTERYRVLTGGLQLLPPSDKLGQGFSTLLDNFKADQADEIRTRWGSNLAAGPMGSGVFHTLRRSENQRFLGIGTSLWHNTFGSHSGTELITGLDGKPLGIAFYRGAAWVMNRNKQKKVRNFGSEVVPWCPSTPATACTATGGGQVTTLISEYDSGDGISVGVDSPPNGTDPFTDYAMKDGVPQTNGSVTADFDSDNKKSGSASLRLKISGAVSTTAYITVDTFDGSVDGQVLDTDLLRVWVFCSNPAAIDALTVYVKTGALGSANEGYVEFTFQNPQKFLNQALNSWTQLKIRRAINIDDWTQQIADAVTAGDQNVVSDLEAQFATALQMPTFLYTGSGWPQNAVGGPPPSTYPPSEAMLRVNWSNMTEVGVTFKTNTGCNVGLDLAEIAGTVGENSSGAITYFISNENTDGEDGPPGPPSNPVIAGTQTITLDDIPVSPDSNTAARRIWRVGGGLSSPLLVGRLVGNTSTGPWVDTTTNRKAQADNIAMPATRGAPPKAKGVVGPYFGKLLAFNTEFHPARYFWTPAGQPWTFTGADDDFLGDWEDAGGDDDELLQVTLHKTAAFLYKRRSIWRLVGDPASADPIQTNSAVSALGENAIVNAGAVDYFVGWEGVYRFNGDYEEKVSAAIDPIFKGQFVELADGEVLRPISYDHADKVCIAIIGDRLRVSYVEQGGGTQTPNVVAVMHIPTGRWSMERYNNLAAPAFSVMTYEGPGFQLMAGSPGGYLYALELEGFYLDNGASAHARWQSPFVDCNLPNNRKVFSDIEIDCATCAPSGPIATLTVELLYDNGTKVTLGTCSSSSQSKPRFTAMFPTATGDDPGITAKNVAVRITSDYLGTIVIYGVYLHWYPEERTAATFDSGPTDLGLPERVKEVDYAEFYMTGAGQSLRRVIASDLPGSILVHRDDITLTAPNGRGTVRARLAAQVDGRNWRMFLQQQGSGVFQMHAARFRMRPIGEYVDGTIGEYFESAEFSIAPGRVGELKDLLLDYDTAGGSGAGRLEVYTDLPGNAMTLARTIALPAQTRAPRVLPFEQPQLSGASDLQTGLPFGQLFKVRIYPPVGGVLRLHGRATFQARVIGVYFDGTRGEIWETQPLDLVDGMGVYREVEVTAQTGGPMTFETSAEMPNNDVRVLSRFTVDTTTTTTGRARVSVRLPGHFKGHLTRFRMVGPYVARLFDVSILGRCIQTNDTPWSWITVPMPKTPDAFAEVNMPVRQTPEEFAWVDLPVDPIE